MSQALGPSVHLQDQGVPQDTLPIQPLAPPQTPALVCALALWEVIVKAPKFAIKTRKDDFQEMSEKRS